MKLLYKQWNYEKKYESVTDNTWQRWNFILIELVKKFEFKYFLWYYDGLPKKELYIGFLHIRWGIDGMWS